MLANQLRGDVCRMESPRATCTSTRKRVEQAVQRNGEPASQAVSGGLPGDAMLWRRRLLCLRWPDLAPCPQRRPRQKRPCAQAWPCAGSGGSARNASCAQAWPCAGSSGAAAMLVLLMLMPCIISSRQRLVGLLHLLACNWRTRQRLGQGPGSGPQEALLATPPC